MMEIAIDETVILTAPPGLSLLKHLTKGEGGASKMTVSPTAVQARPLPPERWDVELHDALLLAVLQPAQPRLARVARRRERSDGAVRVGRQLQLGRGVVAAVGVLLPDSVSEDEGHVGACRSAQQPVVTASSRSWHCELSHNNSVQLRRWATHNNSVQQLSYNNSARWSCSTGHCATARGNKLLHRAVPGPALLVGEPV